MVVRRHNDGWTVDLWCSPSNFKDLEASMLKVLIEAFELWCKKQHDYGSQNIAIAGETGVALRANDKIQRLRTLTGEAQVAESRRDTWLDLINYAAMGVLLNDGEWPPLSPLTSTCPTCGKDL